jgi:hypothetical protein
VECTRHTRRGEKVGGEEKKVGGEGKKVGGEGKGRR